METPYSVLSWAAGDHRKQERSTQRIVGPRPVRCQLPGPYFSVEAQVLIFTLLVLINKGETHFGQSGLRVHSMVAGTNEGHLFYGCH